MAVALEDQLAGAGIEARVELRVLPERERRRLQEKARQGEGDAALPSALEVAAEDLVEVGNVGAVEVGHVGHERRRQRHTLGDRAPEVGERQPLDRAPLLEPGQRRRLEPDRRQRPGAGRAARGLRRARGLGAGRPARAANVGVGDPAAGTGALYRAQIDAELAREPAGGRRGRDRTPRRGPRGRARRGRSGPGQVAVGERDEHLAHLHRLTRLDVDPLHAPGERRRNLDLRLVGLDLEEGRIFADHVALVHEHADDLRLGESLAQIGQREDARHR